MSGSIKTEKSGYKVEVPVIILPVLQKTIDAGPCGDLTFIVGENGRPLTKETFGNVFKAACKAASARSQVSFWPRNEAGRVLTKISGASKPNVR